MILRFLKHSGQPGIFWKDFFENSAHRHHPGRGGRTVPLDFHDKSAAKGDLFSSKKLTFSKVTGESHGNSHAAHTVFRAAFLDTVSGIPDFPADTLRTMQIKILMAHLRGDRLIPEIAPSS